MDATDPMMPAVPPPTPSAASPVRVLQGALILAVLGLVAWLVWSHLPEHAPSPLPSPTPSPAPPTPPVPGGPVAVIKAPALASVGELVVLDASASTGATSYDWQAVDSPPGLAVNGDLQYVFASGTPGVRTYALAVAGKGADGRPAVSLAVTSVTIGSPPGPSPTPPAPTPPGPTPTPKAPPAWATVVYDASADPATLARYATVYDDPTLIPGLAAIGVTCTVRPATDKVVAARNLLAPAQARGLPACVIQDKAGGILDTIALPGSAKSLVTAIAAYKAKATAGVAVTGYTRSGMPYIDHPTGRRYLGHRPPSRPSSLPRYSASNSLIPRSQWKHRNNRSFKVAVLDQGEIGSCDPHANVTAAMYCRAAAGMTPQILSGPYLYTLVNGGSDDGSSTTDCVAAMLQTGTCLLSQAPEGTYLQSQFPDVSACNSTAPRFRAASAFSASTFDEVGSAIQEGRFGAIVTYVGAGFGDVDSQNHATDGVDGSTQANHCMAAVDVAQLADGTWCLVIQNSWGTSFADGGFILLDETQIQQQGGDFAVYAASVDDPQEKLVPPPVATSAGYPIPPGFNFGDVPTPIAPLRP